MRLYLLALNPTDSVSHGFLPAARRLGLRVTVLTDQPAAHRAAGADEEGEGEGEVEVLECDVRDVHAVITRISTHHTPDAVFSNSDHLQTQTALAAAYFGLTGKDWRAALRTKDKALMRRRLAETGADTVWSAELAAGQDPGELRTLPVPYPCVLKPREGVASEDVVRAEELGELVRQARGIRARRGDVALVVEEYLDGELYTLETLGDEGGIRHVLGGFHSELSPPPHFIELGHTYVPAHPEDITRQVLAQLAALGVGLGACHTEFVVREGRARLIEVNYRAIGDQCDLLLARMLGIPLFEHILRTHLGEPLAADLGARENVRARVVFPLADRAGTLVSAPEAAELEADGVRLAYRPLRATGERHELYRTNRDFLGVVRAYGTEGTDQATVDRAVDAFLAARSWEIAP
ncbi:ATP-grasp domain-containing protein [Streptomyces sp. NPDC054796]